MKMLSAMILGAGMLVALPSHADSGELMLGAGLGGALGAVVGQQIGGHDGAIVGGHLAPRLARPSPMTAMGGRCITWSATSAIPTLTMAAGR